MESLTANTIRDSYLDNVKGFLIILVVIGHIVQTMYNNFAIGQQIYMFLSIFHMPMFAIISGYISKLESGIGSMEKQFQRILIPFLIFQTLLITINYLYDPNPITIKSFLAEALSPQFALWYLFCLFCWRLTLPYFMKMPNPVSVSLAIGLLGGFLPKYGDLFSCSRMLGFFPYFILGYCLKTNSLFLNTFIKARSNKKLLAISISISILFFAVICSVLFNGKYQSIYWYDKLYVNADIPYLYSVIIRFISYFTAIVTGFSFIYLIPKTRSIITAIGQKSLYVYLLHSAILYVFVCNHALNKVTDIYVFIAISLLGVPLSALLATKSVATATGILVEPVPIFSLLIRDARLSGMR